MISEQQVLAALPPWRGFIRTFVEACAHFSDGHIGYALADGLAIMTQLAPMSLSIRGQGTQMFILNVGPSSESRKTEGIRYAVDILRDVALGAVSDQPGSREVLFDLAAERGRFLVVWPEGGDFFATTERGQYLYPLKLGLTSLYDGMFHGRTTVKKRDAHKGAGPVGAQAIIPPRVSFLAGCTPSQLEDYTDTGDWLGGFMARFFIIHAERERYMSLANRPQMLPDFWRSGGFVDHLKRMDGLAIGTKVGLCNGFDAGGGQAFMEWDARRSARKSDESNPLPEMIISAWDRAAQHVDKIALLLAWDNGRARVGDPFFLTADEVSAACKIVDLHLASLESLSTGLMPNQDMRDKRRVLRQITDEVAPVGQITSRSFMLYSNRFRTIIDTLIREKRIDKGTVDGDIGYKLHSDAPILSLAASGGIAQVSNGEPISNVVEMAAYK